MGTRPHPDSTHAGAAQHNRGGHEGAPATVGRHEVTALLGAGGMGEVYAVRDPRLGREVAAKLIRGTATAAATLKFHREARITGLLEHPGIVPLYELDTTASGEPYFTMRRVEGATLQARLDGPDPPDLAERLTIFAKVCDATGYAHAQGVIHRDLKPDNIMTGPFGEVYVMDWGLARFVGPHAEEAAEDGGSLSPASESALAATQDGAIVGTPAFMAPEQAAGKISELDARTDVYALGAILYVLVCGRPPYDGPTPWALIGQILDGPPPPPSTRAPAGTVPWELEAVAMRALAHDPRDRYASAATLGDDIRAYTAGRMVGAARYGVLGALAKWIRAHRVALGAAASVAVIALAVAGYHALRERRAHRERVASTRSALLALDPAGAIEAARRVHLAEDPAARALPSAGELTAIAELASRTQRAVRAAAEWAAEAPEDTEAARWQRALLLALGRLAEARLEDSYAENAYLEAVALEPENRDAAQLAARAAGGAKARRAVRQDTIARRLIEAGAGELDDEAAFSGAVAELSSFREEATVDAFVAEVEDGVSRLLRGAQAAYGAAGADALPAERLAHALFDATAPYATPEEMQRAMELENQFAARALGIDGSTPLSGRAHFAQIQEAAVNAQEVRRDMRLKLACAVLGQLDDAARSIGPLVRLAWADASGHHAEAAGVALARLAGRSRDAERALLGLVGLTPDQKQCRYDVNGAFWTRAGRELTRARRSASAADESTDRSPPRSAAEWNRRGVSRMYLSDTDGALTDFSRAVELDPTCGPAWSNHGCILERRGDFAGAIADHSRAIEQCPSDATAWMNRGNARRAAGDLDGAIADLDHAIELNGRSPVAYANRGNVHRVRRNFDLADADYDRALQLDPRFTGALVSRGAARAAQGAHARAIAEFTRAIELDPRHAEAYSRRAESRLALLDYAGAAGDATRALGFAPEDAEGRYTRACARLQLGKTTAALEDLDHLLGRFPTNIAYLGMRGAARLLAMDFSGAEVDLDRAIEIGTQNAIIYANRGTVRVYRRDFSGALTDFDRAIEIDPTAAFAWARRGNVRVDMGDHSHALADMDRALELDPTAAVVWAHRGAVRHALGDFAGALTDLDRAIELDPTAAAAWARRARVRQDARDLAGAIADVGHALELEPTTAALWIHRARLHQLLGQPGQAHEDIDRAIELDRQFANAWLLRADLRVGERDLDGAMADVDHALVLEPTNAAALRARGRLRAARGDIDGAITDLRAAISLDPKDWEAYMHLGVIHHHQGLAELCDAAFTCALNRVPADQRAIVEAARKTLPKR